MKAKLILLIAITVVLSACSDKEAEKKIASLEARVSALEGKRPAQGISPQPVATAQPEKKPDGPTPAFQFETTEHDFGKINEGEKVSYTYKFKNVGESPLIIQDAKGSCGCTASDWTKNSVPVGGEGFVRAEFDSNGKPDFQQKTVTVTANTWPRQTVLKFKAMVTPKSQTKGPVK